MNPEELISCAIDIGEQMLLSGAEVGRVETTVKLICTAYRCRRADVFTITSSIVVSIISEEGIHLTQTRRIQGATTDLTRRDRLNDLSREICRTTPNYACVHEKLCQICAAILLHHRLGTIGLWTRCQYDNYRKYHVADPRNCANQCFTRYD